jgi:UTP--glucose-1-phosphate uridylyltransferase
MKITKAVITAAAKEQRTLPLQTLIDSDGNEKSVLNIIIEEILKAGIEEICVVVQPGDEASYSTVVGDHIGRLNFVHQTEALGYGFAVSCAKDFIGKDPFLHLVGDHLYVSNSKNGCAKRLVDVATAHNCAVSAVQATRENSLPYFGTIGGKRVPKSKNLFQIETVIEKPTPTVAEQKLIIPGLRAGHYLCFFGMHVLTPSVIEILENQIYKLKVGKKINFSAALNELAKKEQYYALEMNDWRFDVGVKYGIMTAQLALALNGKDRELVLSKLLELLALREQKMVER